MARNIEDSLLSDAVGAGGVPEGVGWAMGAAAVALFAKTFSGRGAANKVQPATGGEAAGLPWAQAALRTVGLVLILVAYGVLLPLLGYPRTVCLLLAASGWLARRRAGPCSCVRRPRARCCGCCSTRCCGCACRSARYGFDAMQALSIALSQLASFSVLAAAFGAVLWGILGGALPGISPSIAMALLLPFTVGMDPTTALVLLASIDVGAAYGGSIPAILIRTPGTSSASAIAVDGYAMAQQGRAGKALGICLMSGLWGGLFGLAVLMLCTEGLAQVALAFTPAAYFSLGILGLSVIAGLSGGCC